MNKIRAKAKAKGYARYFDGIPCIHSHIAERYAASGRCVVCTDKDVSAKRSYHRIKSREWRDKKKIEKANSQAQPNS